MKPTIFEPRLKFKPLLKFFKFGLKFVVSYYKVLKIDTNYEGRARLIFVKVLGIFSKDLKKNLNYTLIFTFYTSEKNKLSDLNDSIRIFQIK